MGRLFHVRPKESDNARMAVSTSGIEVPAASRALRDGIELISSMRFAISLLTIICIASVIGTVVKQHEPPNNYVNQFGPFWAEVFGAVNLYTVYSAWWFLLILAFLVTSTSLCIARNAPKILGDLKNYKESIREQALNAFPHRAKDVTAETPDAAYQRVSSLLVAGGWSAKVEQRRDGEGDAAVLRGTMIAARKGSTNKLGYIAAHSAIVLICIGGLFDGDLVVRAQMFLLGKTPFPGSGLISEVPPEHRLSPANPTFRANLLVPEGGRSGTALLNFPNGVVLQDLPFDIELKNFIVEYYSTGMPSLFASEILIHDHETGETFAHRVEVNKPAEHRGIVIYQSSFDDGGSTVKLRAVPMTGGRAFEVEGQIGGSTQLTSESSGEKLTLEYTALRVINVENFGAAAGAATDVRKVDLVESLHSHLGSGAKTRTEKVLRNVGPSITYKLRDAAGQAREYQNYMLPVELDGTRVFLAGVRENTADNFRYLRIPADENDSVQGWTRLRQALADPAMREKAALRYVAQATPTDKPEMAAQLQATALRSLALFAGAEPIVAGQKPPGGLASISDFLEANVPESDRGRISEVLLRVLNGTLFELLNLSREEAGLKPVQPDDKLQAFMTQAVVSLSDSFFYPAPVLFELTDFTQVQASVFQVARAPGKTLVYLGSVFLIIGVFAMLYIRERRLWVWLQPTEGGTKILAALSTTRRTLDVDEEFEKLKLALLTPGDPSAASIRTPRA
jgi:cytochrome c biogenesis protein